MAAETITAPYKIAVTLDKHFDGDTTHAPDETLTVEQWFDADGTEISDPARIDAFAAGTAGKDQ